MIHRNCYCFEKKMSTIFSTTESLRAPFLIICRYVFLIISKFLEAFGGFAYASAPGDGVKKHKPTLYIFFVLSPPRLQHRRAAGAQSQAHRLPALSYSVRFTQVATSSLLLVLYADFLEFSSVVAAILIFAAGK